ncbi:MAG: hypothetical protein EP319_08680 [Deltaproteobacteria bacterium]|nr:MAG: hypothetical protein EP319_08680 [Deltaproteobacteria bacterium]
MEKRFSKLQSLFFFMGASILLTGLHFFKETTPRPLLQISMEDRATNYDGMFLKFSSLGNSRMVSSLLWMHTLLFSDTEHYKNDDLNSWMFQRFNTITDLEPKMYEAYFYGGQYLSIVKDDVFGAEEIFNKGLSIYPEDLWLNYLSGFNYIYEIGDREKGIKRFLKIESHPKLMSTFPILPSIISKLMKDTNDPDSLFIILKTAWEKAPDDYLKNHYWNSMYSLKAEKDLECLNLNERNCSQTDLEGNLYIQSNGVFVAQREWVKFEIKKRERKKRSPSN